MSSFSVKKPMTVLVAVIVVFVLGIVSYTRMTPDLLPSIDLPYVVVVTPYPGASPEKVEQEVTKPLEQSMATLENINNVQSSSAENYSMIILEFTDEVNMDSISVDILQKVDMIEGGWGDMVGSPTILKINPNMLPVMVAAVSMEGKDTVEVSDFTKETLLPKLEGTSGVASITSDGLLEETMSVTFDQGKIDRLNKRLRKAIDEQIDEAKAELDDAKAELESGKAEINKGKEQLEAGKDALKNQTGAAQQELNAKEKELQEAKKLLTEKRAELEAQLETLESTEQMLAAVSDSLTELESSIASLSEEADALKTMQARSQALAEEQLAFEEQKLAIRMDATLSEEEKEQAIAELEAGEGYVAMQAALAELDAQLAARELTRETLPAEIAKTEAALAAAKTALAAAQAVLSELDMDREMLAQSLAELREGKQQLQGGIDTIDNTLKELQAGEVQLDAALAMLDSEKTAAVLELSTATAQLLDAEAQLNAASAQIEQGFDAVEEGRQTAYDRADLEAILTIDTVSSLLMAQNFAMPAGYAEQGGLSTLISVGDEVTSFEELQDLVLMDLNMDGIAPIRLSDVATVERADNRDQVYARVNQESGVLLSFSKQSSYATAEVSENLLDRFEQLEKEYEGLTFIPLMDQGDYIFMMVESILQNLLLSALFAVLVLFLFLKDIKPTLITLLSIPVSVLFALVLMYFTGVTLNMISLSALAVSIGMLVDNSVVVIENTFRLRHRGVDPLRAAVYGAKQVAGAVAASTLTTICVFLPIVFVDGMTRDLFTDMALTIGYALMASLIVSLTLVPAMSHKLLANVKEHKQPIMDVMIRGYQKTLKAALSHRILVLIVTVLLLVGSTALCLMRGFIFMPPMSSTQLTVTVDAGKDATTEDTKAITEAAMARIMEIEGVQTVGAMLASDMMTGAASENTASMYVILDEDYMKDSAQIVNLINEECDDLAGTVTAAGSGLDSSMAMLSGSGVALNVYGDDLQTLQKTAADIAAILSQVDSLENVSDGMEEADLSLHFTVDKEKAAEKGLTVAQVYTEIAALLKTEAVATSITENGKMYDVEVIGRSVPTPDEVKEYVFTVETFDGETVEVKLADVATAEERMTPSAINRDEQRRYMTVSAQVVDGHNVTLATADAQAALKDMALPAGVTIEFTGENEMIMEAVGQMLLMLVLGILLVYLVMVAQFQSLKSPFIVMFTIPLAFTGGFIGLLITGMEVSVISLIGFVMLCGIIVNNGIVLVDYINQLRADGMEKRDALLEAGVTRMRPILMTTITTVLGLVMTALGTGSGSEMMQPIAVVCIGGLVYATLMTLYVVPIMYDLFNRKELKVITDEMLTDVEEGGTDTVPTESGETLSEEVPPKDTASSGETDTPEDTVDAFDILDEMLGKTDTDE